MKKENLSSPRTFQPTPESIKSKPNLPASKTFKRRSFLKGIGIAGAATVDAGLLTHGPSLPKRGRRRLAAV